VVIRKVRDIDEAKYWIDLERNGLVLAAEMRRLGVLCFVIHSWDVRSFTGKSGRHVWLPTTIVMEQFGSFDRETKKIEPRLEPWCRWTTRILPESVKLDPSAWIEEHKPVDPFKQKTPEPIGLE
jgi:hypothetical protein